MNIMESLEQHRRDTCPDCGEPITFQPSGWWTHDGLAGDCWRASMDGPTEGDAYGTDDDDAYLLTRASAHRCA